jgi:hypothetical protein
MVQFESFRCQFFSAKLLCLHLVADYLLVAFLNLFLISDSVRRKTAENGGILIAVAGVLKQLNNRMAEDIVAYRGKGSSTLDHDEVPTCAMCMEVLGTYGGPASLTCGHNGCLACLQQVCFICCYLHIRPLLCLGICSLCKRWVPQLCRFRGTLHCLYALSAEHHSMLTSLSA